MSYTASVPDIQQNYLGKVIGSGQCVAFVEAAAKAPLTAQWTRGRIVAGDTTIPEGTAIATFDPAGTYGNHMDGRSHGAIYVSQIAGQGLDVYDQWLGQPVHQRTIHFRNGAGPAVNDGDQFYVVE
jgi:hypothetical protein